jgi:hypothetical protein
MLITGDIGDIAGGPALRIGASIIRAVSEVGTNGDFHGRQVDPGEEIVWTPWYVV